LARAYSIHVCNDSWQAPRDKPSHLGGGESTKVAVQKKGERSLGRCASCHAVGSRSPSCWQPRQLSAQGIYPQIRRPLGLTNTRIAFCYADTAGQGSVLFARANAVW